MPPDNERGRPVKAAPTVSTAISTETSLRHTMTEPEAARLTTKIQLRLDMIADSTELVIPMIEEAKNGSAHQVLGYPSWTAYVADNFGGVLARLTKSERLPFVELMADQGMSTRAIATVVGVSKDTVSRDLRAGVSDETPARAAEVFRLRPDEIDGLISSGLVENLDDLERCMKMGEASDQDFEQALIDARRDDDLSNENVAKKIKKIIEKKTTGIDGKTYTRPEPKKHRAEPLPDRYRRKALGVAKATGQLRDLTDNRRRYPPNAAAITDVCADDVLQALADIVTVVGRLDPQVIATSQRRREFVLTQVDRLNDAPVCLRNQAGGDAA
jgi:hypothetical protein